MFCYFFVIIFRKVFPVFPTASSNDLIYIDIYASCFTTRSRPTTMRRKVTILFTLKISFMHLLVVSMEAPLNGFLKVIMSWSMIHRLCLFRLEIYSLRHVITYKVLSSCTLYSTLSRGLPFLECLCTSVGMKVTDKLFRTILLILNNIIV